MPTSSTEARAKYTWDDYQAWSDRQRWEIIGGEAYAMTPAPTPRHQLIQGRLDRRLREFFEGKPCEVYPAPIDVKLSAEDIVQPDLAVVCNPSQAKRTHISGPPALVVEILSPSTAAFDRVRKMALYARSRVGEVWLITPYPWMAEVFRLDGDSFRLACVYGKDDELESVSFPGLRIALAGIFDYPIDPDEHIEMVHEGHPPYGKARAVAAGA